ncbi:IQ motif, EF-hand binding site [Corchorus olitorius]|uniref:IQ motif, EF-hand binding site n=1 Tax=Corchorus olitorius TaxID=93759 RepID=A0A1R3H3H5_9ROSI|nr:IQ motif, EF-hand binding site [Corchorus olitorius]
MGEEPFSSSLLKDVTNFKTPKRPSKNPSFQSPCPQYFTASKQTPRSSSSFRHRSRPSLAPSSSRSKTAAAAARKFKAFELDQSQSARKEQVRKQQSLKSLSKSLTVWLNFLFQNPKSCGCDLSINGGDDGNAVQVDIAWRNPKRMRELWWRGEESENVASDISSSKYSTLRTSLKEVCSFDDLKKRMQIYLSLASCKEIFDVMTQVVKNIDEGRLKMKAHCPIVTDFGLKEKASKILLSYNPIWLRIGLYIVFGGDSLLSDGDISSEQDISFLKMVIDKQFFSHNGLAKAYAYNKKVEGLYRPGYYENLGNVILKRILLLVLILDRAKSLTSLPLKYGIDGVDGGSPLLFTISSGIKSSRQVLNDFLSSDVMHGEGNLLAHLVIVGYKVSHQQSALVEFDFQVSDIFTDLQDGVRLCRAIQLLRHESSILMKIILPSDTHKKNLANCGVALQYLRQAGVMLCDEDGMKITGDDVADGDKELTLSLLWNMFVHLQLPLLLDKTIIADEISKIHGFNQENVNVINPTLLGMLLNWIQAICEKYDLKIDSFSSLVNGEAIWCLLDYYFRRELSCSCFNKDSHEPRGQESIVSATDYTDAVHNFVLSQKLTALLGTFPEVLQISDLLEHNAAVSDQSVVVLLVFLLSQLIVKKNVDQLNFHKLLGCNCQKLERRRSLTRRQLANSEVVVHKMELDMDITEDGAKKFKAIQAWWRDMTERNYKSVVKPAASASYYLTDSKTSIDIQRHDVSSPDRVKAATVIQKHARGWMVRSRKILGPAQVVNASVMCQGKGLRNSEIEAATMIQIAWKKFVCRSLQNQTFAATKIQSHFRGWQLRRIFVKQKQAIIKLQSNFRRLRCLSAFHYCKTVARSAIIIQSHVRGWIAQRKARRYGYLIVMIQRHCRGWLVRKELLLQRNAVIKIQRATRGLKCQKAFNLQKQAATEIQRFIRGQITRNRLLGASSLHAANIGSSNFKMSEGFFRSFELTLVMVSVLKLQRWWRGVLLRKLRTKSAIIIQSHLRGWIARQKAQREKHCTVLIQSYWKGYLARKESREQLMDLRLRMLKSAKNVDDSKRIINRLLSALSELLSMKSVSGILHICETLDTTTAHSLKCCEELVAAGAIGILLKQIRSVSRSIPDQEVLKHALSTLRNLARYQHLTKVLIETPGCVEIILWELHRNKEEGYFIAAELMKKICSTEEGVKTVHKLPAALLKRLHNLVEELTRKSNLEKRNPRAVALRENTDRRLREAVEIIKLIRNG